MLMIKAEICGSLINKKTIYYQRATAKLQIAALVSDVTHGILLCTKISL